MKLNAPKQLCCLLLFAFGVCVGCTAAQPAADYSEQSDRKVVRVYLLSGQSNMQGSGVIDQLPDTWRQPIEGAYFFADGRFGVLTPGATPLNGRQRFGPELGFARAMRSADPEHEIYIIKFARSGQPLHAGWDGNQWAGAEPAPGRKTFYPGLTPDDPNIGKHYRDQMRHVRAGFDAIRELGLEPSLTGVVWMQGEQDAKHAVSATQYAQSLGRFKARIEEDLDSEPVPFVFGQVLPHEPALARFTHRAQCRQAMANADQDSGHADAISGCVMVPTEAMVLLKDTVHYSTEGQQTLGMAFAVAMIDAHSHE